MQVGGRSIAQTKATSFYFSITEADFDFRTMDQVTGGQNGAVKSKIAIFRPCGFTSRYVKNASKWVQIPLAGRINPLEQIQKKNYYSINKFQKYWLKTQTPIFYSVFSI